jgi:hypothetical protein
MEERQVMIDASLGEGNRAWSATLLISSRISEKKKKARKASHTSNERMI